MMKRRHRRFSEEINLTPLLDVLFVVLFVVMLSGFSGNIAGDAKLKEKDVENAKLQDKISSLERELEVANDTNRTYGMYEEQTIFITIENLEENGIHVLRLYKGMDREELPEIQMGEGKVDYISHALSERLKEQIEEAGDMPVFVVFHRDSDRIYRKEEDLPIENTFQELSKEKQFFYDIREKQK